MVQIWVSYTTFAFFPSQLFNAVIYLTEFRRGLDSLYYFFLKSFTFFSFLFLYLIKAVLLYKRELNVSSLPGNKNHCRGLLKHFNQQSWIISNVIYILILWPTHGNLKKKLTWREQYKTNSVFLFFVFLITHYLKYILLFVRLKNRFCVLVLNIYLVNSLPRAEWNISQFFHRILLVLNSVFLLLDWFPN